MNTSVINLPNSNVLTSRHSTSVNPSATTTAIIHLPHQDKTESVDLQKGNEHDETLKSSASTVHLREEIIHRFNSCYQKFVGYPVDDFQFPTNTKVKYSLLNHSTANIWETPTVKAGIAGLGGVLTTLSIGILLSDNIPNSPTSSSLSYQLPTNEETIEDSVDVVPQKLDVSSLTLSDRPSIIHGIEFSGTSEIAKSIANLERINVSGQTQLSPTQNENTVLEHLSTESSESSYSEHGVSEPIELDRSKLIESGLVEHTEHESNNTDEPDSTWIANNTPHSAFVDSASIISSQTEPEMSKTQHSASYHSDSEINKFSHSESTVTASESSSMDDSQNNISSRNTDIFGHQDSPFVEGESPQLDNYYPTLEHQFSERLSAH